VAIIVRPLTCYLLTVGAVRLLVERCTWWNDYVSSVFDPAVSARSLRATALTIARQ
jgi:hypothetical protein